MVDRSIHSVQMPSEFLWTDLTGHTTGFQLNALNHRPVGFFLKPLLLPLESSSSSNWQTSDFRVHVKGLVEQMVGGIGVAIWDGDDGLVFEVSEDLSWNEHQASVELVEVKALIERLNVSIMPGLNRINVVSDNPLLHEYFAEVHSRESFQLDFICFCDRMKEIF